MKGNFISSKNNDFFLENIPPENMLYSLGSIMHFGLSVKRKSGSDVV